MMGAKSQADEASGPAELISSASKGRRHDRSRDVHSIFKVTLDHGAPMVWTPPSRRRLRSAVNRTEGEPSCRSPRIGLDLAKYVFEIHGVDARGKTIVRKTLRRHAVSTFFANLPPCLVGMEASNGAHFWAKALSELGHDVRLISPQFVTPYVKSNKNDCGNAEAIATASAPTGDALCAHQD